MGRDLHGRMRVTDLAAMPHLLIAGSTGTGKSVFINSLMMSILYKASPEEVKLVLVDPKRLELNLYENIPHLIAPVVTDPKIASNVLRNATREMENRLKLLAQRGVRNIDQYNRTFKKEQSLSLFDNLEELLEAPKDENGKAEDGADDDVEGGGGVDDDLYQDAIRVVCDAGRASTSTLQRRLRIGYGRAARLIDLMEKDGIVGPPDGTKPREVLKNRSWMKEFDDSAH